ncbi:hypothetical protein [Bordetella sp. FB-8]|uniref:hypothetical protein n=1 Tax=Bordetella sp. FB-8 TaxID=1159870 RepID=UPI0003679648|nr:hypothetical protein [Bordetella sp. FB-8]
MMMLFPLLTAMLAICYGIRGRRPACVVFWLLTLGLCVAWACANIDGPHLPLAL